VTQDAAPARRPAPAVEPAAGPLARKMQRLQIRDLGKRFGEAAALHAFDLDVHGGEFISLLGPSGCGKSTALNCIAGLLEPDAGSILLDDLDLVRVPTERRGFGMVFQNYALFPHMTVARNVAFGLEMMGVAREAITRRVAQALALVHLEGLGDRYPAQMSGGQQQRVALARALVVEPRLLLLDEPLSNLDAKLRLEMRLEIRRLHQTLGLTTLYVTHDQEEALSLSDRIALMQDGTIRQVGTPEEVYRRPQSPFVANFLGYRNLLDVTVGARHDGRVDVVVPGGLTLTGTPQGDVAAGAAAVAAVRPEDVEIVPAGHAVDQGVPARLELAEFLGNVFECILDAGAGVRLIARTPERWPEGGAVVVRLAPDRLLVFPRE